MARAIVCDGPGGVEVLTVKTDWARPAPASGQLLIKAVASGVNPVDLAVRAGHFPVKQYPKVRVGRGGAL